MACQQARLLAQVEFEEPLKFGQEADDSHRVVIEALQKALNTVSLLHTVFFGEVLSMYCA